MTMFGSQWLANPGVTYEIEQSIRFNSGDSATMTRSFGTPTDQNKFTYAFWIKSTTEQNGYTMGINVSGGVTFAGMIFNGGNMAFYDYTSGSANIDVRTTFTSATGKFRDYSAWYHAMFVYDSDQSTDSNRLKFYINGTQFPAADLVGPSGGSVVWPGSGANSKFNASGTTHRISDTVNGKVDGYMADIYFIDGQALTPSSFGEFSSTTGEFIPIEYSGTFGNNGFHIDGRDSSDLGDDESGNGNDFTTSGLAAADQVSDSPTDNFCVMSPIDKSSAITLSDGNLIATNSGTNSWNHGRGTMFASSGKWYYEWTPTAGSYALAGWMTDVGGNDHVEEESDPDTTYYRGVGSAGRGVVIGDGSPDTGPANFSNGDVVMMAIDVDTMKFWVGVDGTWYNSGDPAAGSNATGTWSARLGYAIAPWYGCFLNTSETFNFGQSSFAHTIPTGFNPWSTAGLGDPAIADPSAYFQATTYTGNGSSQSINQSDNSTFEPSMVWIKSRSATTDHVIQDQVRGNFVIYPNQNSAEGATGGGWVSSFDSDGFTVASNAPINDSGETFVGWQWKGAGSGSSNSDGDITSTVSADTTSGFSIVTYSGSGTSGDTVGHGLGVKPSAVIVKPRNAADNWIVNDWSGDYANKLKLNADEAASSSSGFVTAANTSTFTLGSDVNVNGSSRTFVAYCWSEVEGFSKFGSYTGNGSTDGPFVPTGFKPAFVIFKNISASSQSWEMFDNKRDGLNDANRRLYPNASDAEPAASDRVRLLSNGFKIVTSGGTHVNGSGNTIIYMAFAKSPFKTATAFGIES